MIAVLDQPALFDAAVGAHFISVLPLTVSYPVEVAGRLEPQSSMSFTWSCSCGDTSVSNSRWSHAELAERMGVHHAEVAA